jgi:hypothetical protein
MVAVVQPRSVTVHAPARTALVRRAPCAGGVPPGTYRRRRAAVATAAVAVLAAAQGVLATYGAHGGSRPSPVPAAGDGFATHVVQPGDTFWTIARGLSGDRDPRPLVDRLVAEHGSAVLHVGERIVLPERR